MTEPLIEYSTAVLAKERGCDLELFSTNWEYEEDGDTFLCTHKPNKPNERREVWLSQSLLAKWLREEHWLMVNVKHVPHDQTYRYTISGTYDDRNGGVVVNAHFEKHNTYEQALEAGLVEALKLIEP